MGDFPKFSRKYDQGHLVIVDSGVARKNVLRRQSLYIEIIERVSF